MNGSAQSSAELSLAKTGIMGLDNVLSGGLPRNRIYLVEGDPGVGKTTLALQFLLAGVKQGESCLYVTLSETAEEIAAIAKSHGWNLDKLTIHELSASENLEEASDYSVFDPSHVELGDTTKAILDVVEKTNPTRVVFDSLSEMRLLASNPVKYRRQILGLKHFFIGRNCTTVLLDDRTGDVRDLQVQSIVHGAIQLQRTSPPYGVARRRLEVVKLRGVPFRAGFHDFNIEHGGLVVFPRLVAAEHHIDFPEEQLKSGLPELDELLGGGIDTGTSTLVLGPAGTGKSSLVAQYAVSAARSGQPTAIFTFDEGIKTLMKRAAALGMDLRPLIAEGRLRLQQIDPAEMPAGEFVEQIRRSVENDKVRVVVIDSLTGYLNAMPNAELLPIQMHELLTYLNQLGVVTLLTMAQHGLVGSSLQAPVDVSYLADSVILLRYFEVEGKIKKAISVVKKRSGTHETTIREYSLGPDRIRVGPPLEQFTGVLTGVPVFSGGMGATMGGHEK